MADNLRNDVRPLETLARFGVHKYRTWCPIHTIWPPEMIGAEQQWCADLGFCKAVSARRRMVGDLAMQEIPGIITASLPESDCALGVHWDAAETHHRKRPTAIQEGRA